MQKAQKSIKYNFNFVWFDAPVQNHANLQNIKDNAIILPLN